MPVPNLLHPVPCRIEQLDVGETIYDPDTRAPVQQAARTTVVQIQGQVSWESEMEFEPSAGGPMERASGYVLFRFVDLNALSITLRQGDRFAKLGQIETDLYLAALEPTGHWQDQGGATMVKAHFTDRQPSRQTKGG